VTAGQFGDRIRVGKSFSPPSRTAL